MDIKYFKISNTMLEGLDWGFIGGSKSDSNPNRLSSKEIDFCALKKVANKGWSHSWIQITM